MFDVGHEIWNTGDSGQADTSAAPDRLVSLVTTVGELYALGTETLQVFIVDATLTFTAGTTVEIGSLAPGSLIKNDAQICFLDHRRRIVATDGRSVQDLTDQAMAKTLQGFATISDCWSFRARFDAADLLGFVFPTEGRMLVYNSAVKKWTEWRSIDTDGRWQPWIGQSHCFWPDQNLQLIGLEDGTISLLDPRAFTEHGAMLKALVRTGFGDRGTSNRKICERIQLLMRRGANTNPTAPQAQLRWRSDLGAFGQPLRISLGAPGDYEAIVNKWTLGVYTVRQWELSMSDPAEFVLVACEEVFTPLEA
jgi:PAS domain-containing protein